MSEGEAASASAARPSAGRLLREAREKQGLHIAALAASIKVSPKKLEMLESDRFDELPDATFTRALAQTVCRALKTDPSAVMRLLPPPVGHRLEQVGEGLNTPFRERPGMLVPPDWMQFFASPAFWLTTLILLAASAIYFLPAGLTGLPAGRLRSSSSPTAHAGVEPGSPADTVVVDVSASQPSARSVPSAAGTLGAARELSSTQPLESPAAALPAAPASQATLSVMAAAAPVAVPASAPGGLPPGMLQFRIVSESWIEVNDGRGQTLVSRSMKAGETAAFDGTPPLRLRIGNAAGTQVVFRGQPTDLKAFTRDNVARLELR
ncbi:MAG: helix-turn-helix domain-containing protein [Caldimonas sp.]